MAKLVRDKIPEIIRQAGKTPKTRIANEGEYWTMLKAKLQEEVEEFLENPTNEELVDIYEVMNAIYDFKKIKKEDLKKLREKKSKERGAFSEKIILEDIK